MTEESENPFARLTAWVQRALFSSEPVSRLKRLVIHNLRVAYLVTRSGVYERVRLHAQALALKTLLAVVPLLAVVFAIFNGFGGLRSVRDRLETALVESLSGSPEVQQVVHEYLVKFVSNVEGGALGPVSVVLLVYSVLSLLGHIEDSINTLFGIKAKRPLVLRFTTYWAALTLGPLVLGASLTLSGAFQLESVQSGLNALPGVSRLLISSTPLLISWFGFTALYLIVPNTKISLSSALSAALIAGTAWNLLKFLYTYYASHAVTMQNIYGSLAAIPLFMLWIWWSWLLVLYGAQLAYSYENASTFWNGPQFVRPPPHARELSAARLLLDVARNFGLGHRGKTQTDARSLAERLVLPASFIDELLKDLSDARLVVLAEDGNWLPARESTTITLADLVAALRDNSSGARLLQPLLHQGDQATCHLIDMWEHECRLSREVFDTSFAELACKFPSEARRTEFQAAGDDMASEGAL